MNPPDAPTRHEIMEERGNRDAFRLFLVFALLWALFLGVLAIAAWNTRFMVMSLPAMPPAPKPAAKSATFFPRSPTAGERTPTHAAALRSAVRPARETILSVSVPTRGPVPSHSGARFSCLPRASVALGRAAGPRRILAINPTQEPAARSVDTRIRDGRERESLLPANVS